MSGDDEYFFYSINDSPHLDVASFLIDNSEIEAR